MKKISGWITGILITALIVAVFTVPSKQKLQQQLQTAYSDGVHINIDETTIKVVAPVATLCSYSITGKPKQVTLKTGGTPLAVATYIKSGTYVGLFGTFWEW